MKKIFYSVYLTAMIVFTVSLIIKYKDLLEPGELFAILILGIYGSLHISDKLE